MPDRGHPLCPQDAAKVGRDPFQLTFQGPDQPVLPQGIYRLSAADELHLSMFLVPVGRVNAGVIYQAVSN